MSLRYVIRIITKYRADVKWRYANVFVDVIIIFLLFDKISPVVVRLKILKQGWVWIHGGQFRGSQSKGYSRYRKCYYSYRPSVERIFNFMTQYNSSPEDAYTYCNCISTHKQTLKAKVNDVPNLELHRQHVLPNQRKG